MATDPDEPIFVLRGRSRFAGALIRCFSSLCRINGEITQEDDIKNREIAAQMDSWHKARKFGPFRKEVSK